LLEVLRIIKRDKASELIIHLIISVTLICTELSNPTAIGLKKFQSGSRKKAFPINRESFFMALAQLMLQLRSIEHPGIRLKFWGFRDQIE
jgi:hypothetical protein